MNKFYPGEELSCRSVGDYDCIYRAVVIKVTSSYAWIIMKHLGEVKVKKFKDHIGNEYCFPLGRYSMNPVFRATGGEA